MNIAGIGHGNGILPVVPTAASANSQRVAGDSFEGGSPNVGPVVPGLEDRAIAADKLRVDHERAQTTVEKLGVGGTDDPVKQAERGNNFHLPDFPLQELSIRMDKDLNRVIVEVRDVSTKEVIRQIPAEGVVEALKQLRGTRGAILDEEG
jgi:FlaG protein